MIKKIVDLLYWRILKKFLRPLVNDIRLNSYLVYGDSERLEVASSAVVRNALFNTISGRIIIKDHVFFGHNVSLLTGVHDISGKDKNRQSSVPKSGRDIVINEGVWISSNVSILGPCEIGKYAVVAAGAVVLKDVAPYTMVAGVPAEFIKNIDIAENQ